MCLRQKYNIHSTFPNAFFCYLLAGESFRPEGRSILKWQIIKIVTNTWNCPAASIHGWHSDCILSEEHFFCAPTIILLLSVSSCAVQQVYVLILSVSERCGVFFHHQLWHQHCFMITFPAFPCHPQGSTWDTVWTRYSREGVYSHGVWSYVTD